ncbi:glyoxalase/bleomycin resistance/dioxygenase family protein [Glycomyces buryatensis]|uniref:VOC domain-containing protein n=1 Tax=Glycomyces buryatensis TaxID=2570927 RepID=A0A4S8PVR3_9ACTN|nr:glyoxalase/bleomycin resistance/dioxygenase family protein [Glycomyces buryatensis]THV35598.1 hypothetical protein FAB82_22230 [Glycomyces buryatensis]
MRQPPRPAPRQAPKAANNKGGSKGAARGGAKGGAKGGGKGGAKGGAKPRTGTARKAAPAQRGKQQQGRPNSAEQLRQQRIMLDQQRRQRELRWFAANHTATSQLHAAQHHSAGGDAIGTVLNGDRRLRWRTSYAVGAFTLLILSFFFASMSIGAQSVGVAVLAFLCLAGGIAFITVEFSARRFPAPVPAPPNIGQHKLEDLIVEDDPPRPKPAPDQRTATLDALNDMFEPETKAPATEPKGPTTESKPPVPEAKAPAAQSKPPEPKGPEPAPAPGVEAKVPEQAGGVEPPPETVPADPGPGPAEPVAAEPIGEVVAAETPRRPIVIEQVTGPLSESEAGPVDELEMMSEAMPPEPVTTAASGGFDADDPGMAFDLSSPPPIEEASAFRSAPTPPRQRISPEHGASLPDGLAELLLSEQRLDGTDVTDVAATLVVADLERSIEFYRDALGLSITDRTDEAAMLDAGFGKILLWERADAPPGETGVMHLTFEVGDIDAAFAEMNQAGVEFLHLPRTALLGQNYEMRAASFRDPDGHGLAITEHRER